MGPHHSRKGHSVQRGHTRGQSPGGCQGSEETVERYPGVRPWQNTQHPSNHHGHRQMSASSRLLAGPRLFAGVQAHGSSPQSSWDTAIPLPSPTGAASGPMGSASPAPSPKACVRTQGRGQEQTWVSVTLHPFSLLSACQLCPGHLRAEDLPSALDGSKVGPCEP